MTGEMCRKDFNKKLKITKHLKKKQHERHFIPSQRYKNFQYFLQNQKVDLKGSFLTSPTSSLKKLKVHSP